MGDNQNQATSRTTEKPTTLRSSRREPQSSQNRCFRPHPGVSKAMHFFGVPDLRDLLNQKHQQPHTERRNPGTPPPDPSYSYLKDPEREQPKEPAKQKPRVKFSTEHSDKPQSSRSEKTNQRGPNKEQNEGSKSPRTFRKQIDYSRGRGKNNSSKHNTNRKNTTVELDEFVNIKVELKTESGERKCIIEKQTKIEELKHVPDYQSRPPRGRGNSTYRGRGRGRGRGTGRLPYKKDFSKPNGENTEKSSTKQDGQTEKHVKFADDVKENNWEPQENEEPEAEYPEDQEHEEPENEHPEGQEESSVNYEDLLKESVTITASSSKDEVSRTISVTPNERVDTEEKVNEKEDENPEGQTDCEVNLQETITITSSNIQHTESKNEE